jgi:hypothetical protein
VGNRREDLLGQLGAKSFNTVKDYAAEFFSFIEQASLMFPHSVQEEVFLDAPGWLRCSPRTARASRKMKRKGSQRITDQLQPWGQRPDKSADLHFPNRVFVLSH